MMYQEMTPNMKRRRLIRRDTLVEPRRRNQEQVIDYLVLCLRYKETPTCDLAGPDPQSAHALALAERAEADGRLIENRETAQWVC